jgi:hypothetical protein
LPKPQYARETKAGTVSLHFGTPSSVLYQIEQIHNPPSEKMNLQSPEALPDHCLMIRTPLKASSHCGQLSVSE